MNLVLCFCLLFFVFQVKIDLLNQTNIFLIVWFKFCFSFFLLQLNCYYTHRSENSSTMASYEEYILQLHHNHDYYGLILMHSKASDLSIRCGLNKISHIIFLGYDCSNAFYCKQWTDFCKIRTILMNRIQRHRYNYHRKDAVKLDSISLNCQMFGYHIPNPMHVFMNILALIINANIFFIC